MKILYGVQATGNGHIARARAMLPYLQQAGIDTDFVFSGAKPEMLFDMDCFGDARFLNGFTLSITDGKLNKINTIYKSNPIRFLRDVQQLNVSDYDLVLTDFEPISAWAAKWRGIPSIGLANQYALRHSAGGMRIPLSMKIAIAGFAPANQYIGLHWYPFHTHILPPITENVPNHTNPHGEFILVYLPSEDFNTTRTWLARFPDTTFHIYTATEKAYQVDNLHIFPLSRSAFLHDIQHCDGVLCNSGFGVCTEALLAGKKILTRPLRGQFEQHVNATLLAQKKRAVILTDFTDESMHNWLKTKNFKPMQFPNVAQAIVQWLLENRQEPITQLSARLWASAQETAS